MADMIVSLNLTEADTPATHFTPPSPGQVDVQRQMWESQRRCVESCLFVLCGFNIGQTQKGPLAVDWAGELRKRWPNNLIKSFANAKMLDHPGGADNFVVGVCHRKQGKHAMVIWRDSDGGMRYHDPGGRVFSSPLHQARSRHSWGALVAVLTEGPTNRSPLSPSDTQVINVDAGPEEETRSQKRLREKQTQVRSSKKADVGDLKHAKYNDKAGHGSRSKPVDVKEDILRIEEHLKKWGKGISSMSEAGRKYLGRIGPVLTEGSFEDIPFGEMVTYIQDHVLAKDEGDQPVPSPYPLWLMTPPPPPLPLFSSFFPLLTTHRCRFFSGGLHGIQHIYKHGQLQPGYQFLSCYLVTHSY
jgi:hypothetical protein